MTRKNMNLEYSPFLLQPVGKDYLWGGSRLRTEYGKNLPEDPLAETWECSTHADGASVIASGPWEGKTLSEILKSYPELLGTNLKGSDELPILIKLIDAKQKLSVQVHPDDFYAEKNENGQHGKTEMWYVLDALPDTRLIYGFSHDMTKEMLRQSLESGSLEKYLQKVHIKKDDVFLINAGTVHAIGAGALIAEIQENSNLTYRMYDYNRVDKNGQYRALHKEKAMEVVNLKGSCEPKQPIRVLKYRRGAASEMLCRCKYFQVERLLLNTEISRNMVPYHTGEGSFHVFLCIEGCGVIFVENGCMLNFFKGDCIFVPANSLKMKFHGKAQLLSVGC